MSSRHFQAVRDLAPGLRATVWVDDGLIERVEPTDGAWTVAIRWYPEDDVETALFDRFA